MFILLGVQMVPRSPKVTDRGEIFILALQSSELIDSIHTSNSQPRKTADTRLDQTVRKGRKCVSKIFGVNAYC